MGQAGEIGFRKPGRGTLTCRFLLTEARLEELAAFVARDAKAMMWFAVDIRDGGGDIVATVRKEIYVRAKNQAPNAG